MLKAIHYLLLIIVFTVLLSIGLFIYFWFFKSLKYKKIKEGISAPDFMILDQNKNIFKLSNHKGKNIVLYFFPKSDTPGCTKESCGLKDNFALYKNKNIEIFGISYDSPDELKAFKDKYNLPFTLLSDSKKEVAKKYGAYQARINSLFPARITILIDQNGKIKKILEKVNIETHAQDILNYF